MLDTQRYRAALLDFLRLLESRTEPMRVIAEHLRFPGLPDSTLVGSDLGRLLWEQPNAKSLIDTLLEDADLGKWFSPPPALALNELRGHVASLVQAWDSPNRTAEQMVKEHADSFLQAVQTKEPASSRVRVFYGVSANDRVELSPGLALEPASLERLKESLARAGAPERDLLRIPRKPAVLAAASVRVSREEFPAMAATTATAWADVTTENTRWDIWLATGVLPRLGDSYAVEHSNFPVVPSERYAASVRESHAQGIGREVADIDAEVLLHIHKRMAVLRGEYQTFPEERYLPLWVASTFMDSAIGAADALMTILLAYAACEGLLLRRDDDDSRFVRRLAILVGQDVAEDRRLRSVAARWMQLRGFAAHGQRPPIETVAAFLEQDVSQEDLTAGLLGLDRLRQAARLRGSQLFRRVFLAMLYCCVTLDSGELPQPSLSRDEVLETLERAASGEDTARRMITDRVPQFVRDIEL